MFWAVAPAAPPPVFCSGAGVAEPVALGVAAFSALVFAALVFAAEAFIACAALPSSVFSFMQPKSRKAASSSARDVVIFIMPTGKLPSAEVYKARFLHCSATRGINMAVIEEEIVHWWKDEKGESHRNALRLERDDAQEINGFPRDGIITVRIMNTVAQQAIKLSPDEALRISTQLLAVAKDLLNQKRSLWQGHNE